MLHFLKIAFPQAEERRAIHLRIAADPVGGLRMEGLALAILPDFVRMVAVLKKDCLGVPILFLLRQKSAAFKDENTLPARSEPLGESAAARARPDDDDVVMVRAHGFLPPKTGS